LNLSELVERLQSNPKVADVSLIEEHGPYKFYRLRIREQDDFIREVAICIYVENEGTDQEAAYFKDSRPSLETASDPLEDQVKSVAASLFLVPESINVIRAGKYAVVRGFVDNGDGTVSRKSYLLYLDSDGKIASREIV